MVCCAFIALLMAGALWLMGVVIRRPAPGDRDPLAWRPHGQPPPEMSEPARKAGFTWSARLMSFAFAARGIGFMLRYEHNAWIHLAATIFVVAAGFVLGITGADWRWIVTAILWVWFAEATNSALEHLCDVVSPGPNESVRIAKDVAAGAVLISAVGAVALGAMTLMTYIVPLAYGSSVPALP